MRPLLFLLVPLLVATPLALAQESEFMLHITAGRYLPDPFEVPPGVEVAIMSFLDPNEDPNDAVHSVTSAPVAGYADKELFHVSNIQPTGEPYFFTSPSAPGTYPYYCIYHGDAQGNGMAGTLVVSGETTATTPPIGTTPMPSTSQPVDTQRETPGAPIAALLVAVGAIALAARRR